MKKDGPRFNTYLTIELRKQLYTADSVDIPEHGYSIFVFSMFCVSQIFQSLISYYISEISLMFRILSTINFFKLSSLFTFPYILRILLYNYTSLLQVFTASLKRYSDLTDLIDMISQFSTFFFVSQESSCFLHLLEDSFHYSSIPSYYCITYTIV